MAGPAPPGHGDESAATNNPSDSRTSPGARSQGRNVQLYDPYDYDSARDSRGVRFSDVDDDDELRDSRQSQNPYQFDYGRAYDPPPPPRQQQPPLQPQSHSQSYPPPLRLNTDLYTIESHTELSELQSQSQPQQRRGPAMNPDAASSSRQPPSFDSRRSVVSFAEQPVSITIPAGGGGASSLPPALSPSSRHRRFGSSSDGSKNAATVGISEANETLAHYRDWVARQRERQRRWTSGPYGRFKARTSDLYRRLIVEGLLRQKPLLPTADGRHIPLQPGRARRKPFIDERSGKPYVSNFIRSSRYTVWDFLPKQLVFQFMKLANFYFLIIAILQMIPGLSTTGTYTTIIPLLIFVTISMGKEGYDDYRRYKLDKVENRSKTLVLDPARTVGGDAERRKGRWNFGNRSRKPRNFGGEDGMTELESVRISEAGDEPDLWSVVEWQDLRVGDIVRLRRDESVPADIVLLHASGPNGVAYIETMALDGETNMKSKQACPLLAENCGSVARMISCSAEVVSEDPNMDLYNYDGRVVVNGKTMPLTLNQVVYRGSTVRNTEETFGLVINTGEECKIRMNAQKNVRAKAPAMQAIVNRIVVVLVIFVVLLAVGCTVGNEIWVPHHERLAWYLKGGRVPLGQVIFGFVIMFNTLIPLSLYVSLEIIKVGQLILMQDIEMYDPETDTPMVANTTTILENLGQVSYVFSDKTGTLTENKMRFRKMSVAGTAWLHDMDVVRDAEERRERRRKMSRRPTKQPSRHISSSKKRPSRTSASEAREPMEAPLIEAQQQQQQQKYAPGKASAQLQRSGSMWRSTVRPAHAQPELKTEDLIRYIRSKPHTPFSRKARHFILCIALCHTCLPETRADGTVEFQAASPDELALVQAARDLGYLLVDRPAQSVKLQFHNLNGSLVTETYEVLDVIEFSSKRKRMSIIIRMPNGQLCMFSKGADSVILPRLKLNQMAIQKASAVERRASKRKSVEQERALMRRMSSVHAAAAAALAVTPRESQTLGRPSMSKLRTSLSRRGSSKRSADYRSAAAAAAAAAADGGGNLNRRSTVLSGEVDEWLTQRETEDLDAQDGNDDAYVTPRQRQMSRELSLSATTPTAPTSTMSPLAVEDPYDGLVDESLALNDGAVFERCFQHIDDFASEGLRTLLFAYRYLEEDDYRKWKTIYHEATTSLANRQERVEAAADLIEQSFDLAGATAIEDKLQQGVPETIDKLRRANIKIWMLTGDKRETAINIAHSARICKPFSEVYILDAEDGDLQERIASTLIDVGRGMIPHSVVVIDGHTLGVVEAEEEMRILFFDLVARVDSVICCRASPAQKATLVKCIRQRVPKSMTLAIGDGANDIAMIQASHVGIGISGREGLQAARIADYSIAQFRFLQRLLFVHGRWNYIRTGRYILGTFWKELLFYLVQAQYQRCNGYTGTSLYESVSLTVFNTLFTSLPVILLGIFEKDLRAETLLAVPELYTFGQRNLGFNFRKYVGWMALAVIEAVVLFSILYIVYDVSLFTIDTTLYAMGSLAFTVCVLFINIKMLVLELHEQTIISALGLFISVSGWFVWNIFLSAIYAQKPGPYLVRNSFLHNFGRSATWWLTGLSALMALVVIELVVSSVRRVFFPTDQDLMQEIEHYAGVKAVMREHAAENGEAGPLAGVAEAQQEHKVVEDDYEDVEDGWETAPVAGAGNDNTAAAAAAAAAANKRSSRRMDDYVPPPFTPPAEERDDPMAAATGVDKGKARAPEEQQRRQQERDWFGDGDGGPAERSFTQSPVELRAPPMRRLG